jgi:hypothetical protein
LISFQKSVAQAIVYEHHRATFERQKLDKVGKSYPGEDRSTKAEESFSKENQASSPFFHTFQQALFIT